MINGLLISFNVVECFSFIESKMRTLIVVLVGLLFLAGCEKADFDDDGGGNVTLRFTPTTADTRGTVVIGDYFSKLNIMLFDENGERVFSQVRTQTADDAGFGTLNVGLTAGTYTVIAVGHSSVKSATIKSPQLVQFTASDGEKLTDTFAYCGKVTVTEDGGSFDLRMNRATAMVRFRLTDELPSAVAKIKIDYTGGSANFNPSSMEGCTKSSQSEMRLAPSAGGEYCVYTFPYFAKSGVLKVTISALSAEGTVLAQKVINDVPVTRNRITTYTGPLISDGVGEIIQTSFGITVNPDWSGEDFYTFERKMTFSMSGDFSLRTDAMTRSLTADGKEMTDVWVLDYMGTECIQTIHQTAEDDDFGQPTLTLAMGDHHLYFIASRGSGATLNTTNHTIIFARVLDTFWKDYAITISAGTSSGSRAVALDRIVSKLKVVFSDAIPTRAATFNLTPASWYYGIDYTTGEPSEATVNGTITVNIPSSDIGVVNEAVSIFGFSSATEWTTNVSIDCKSSDSSILGSATITAAPFVRNRVSEYTGPLFTAGGVMTLSLNTEWDESYQGTW